LAVGADRRRLAEQLSPERARLLLNPLITIPHMMQNTRAGGVFRNNNG